MSYKAAVLGAYDNEDTFATTLFAIMLDMFGDAGFADWDPQTIALEFKAHTGVTWDKVPAVNRDKLMMMTGVYTSNTFFRQLNVFIAACNAFCGAGVDVRTFDPATVDEMAWAVTEVKLAGFEEDFHPEIKAYVGVQAALEGFESLPPTLSWGDKPKSAGKSAEAAAEGGVELFAAGYSQNRDEINEVEAEVKRKVGLMLDELAKFPFANRVEESA
jgi:hypothetical protein